MDTLKNKVDFMMTIEVVGANPNGDPLSENMPRVDVNGFGEISDVCIKRKIRNRMQDLGNKVFIQSDFRNNDGFTSLEDRFKDGIPEGQENRSDEDLYNLACEKWLDIRTFGQILTFAYNQKKDKKDKKNKLSIGIRGPVSINIAKSLYPIIVDSLQITKSVNSESSDKKTSDRMGTKHLIDYGVYLVKGSINCFFAEKTGFKVEDKEILKECLTTLFDNDASSARPEGSMIVKQLFWFEHPSKTGSVPSSKIFNLFKYNVTDKDNYLGYNIYIDENELEELDKNINLEIFDIG